MCASAVWLFQPHTMPCAPISFTVNFPPLLSSSFCSLSFSWPQNGSLSWLGFSEPCYHMGELQNTKWTKLNAIYQILYHFLYLKYLEKAKLEIQRVSDYWLGLVMRIGKEHKGSFWNEEIILKWLWWWLHNIPGKFTRNT